MSPKHTLSDIQGLGRCDTKRIVERTGKMLIQEQEFLFPGAGKWIVAQCGGEEIYIPKALRTTNDIFELLDKRMSVERIADKLGYSVRWVEQVIKGRA